MGKEHNNKVISFPLSSATARWKFYDFVQPNDKNPIEDWKDELSEYGQELFDTTLKNCSKIEKKEDWSAFRGSLKGVKGPIWEIGFKADRRQYRVFCVHRKENTRQVILLIGCYHKQRAYHPRNAIKTAEKRYKQLIRGEAKISERKIPKD